MSGRIKFIALFSFLTLLSGCGDGNSTSGVRPCLSTPSGCGALETQTESTFSGDSGASSGFTCSVVSDPPETLPYQPVRVQITTVGGSGAKKVIGFSQAFSSVISLFGSYNADKVGTVVSRTVTVEDANGLRTSCVANVKVSSSIGGTGLGCTVALRQNSLRPGDTANFLFTATGNTGRATFTKFYPTSTWLVPDQFLRRPTDSTAEVDVRYDIEGQKVASIQVADSSGKQAFCSLSFSVGTQQALVVNASPGFTTNLNGFIDLTAVANVVNASNVVYTYSLPVADANVVLSSTGSNTARVASTKSSAHVVAVKVTAVGTNVNLERVVQLNFQNGGTSGGALTACNVQSAPLGFPSENSAASIQGSITRLRVFPNGGVGPFQVELLGVYDSSGIFPFQILNDVPRAHDRQMNLRLSRAGNPEIRVRIRDVNSNATATCSTFHISKKSDVYVVSADADAYGTTGPLVKVFKGSGAALMENFHAFGSTYRGGTRVATADFDGDGIADYLVGRGYGAVSDYGPTERPGFKVFKGSDTSYYAGKPAPPVILQVSAAFDTSNPDRLYIGAGDVTADGRADAIVGSGCNAASGRVRIFSGANGVMVADFLAHSSAEGVRVSGGDVNGDGFTDVITSTCSGTHVRVYSGKSISQNYPAAMTQVPTLLYYFNPYPSAAASVNVRTGSGDIDRDGYADIITSSFGNSAPYVVVYSGRTGGLLWSINAFPTSTELMKVSAGDMNGDGYADLMVGGLFGSYTRMRIFDGAAISTYAPGSVLSTSNLPYSDFSPISDFRGSIYLGGGTGGL